MDERYLKANIAKESRRGSLYANQRAEDTHNEITFMSRTNSHKRISSKTPTPNLSRRGTPSMSRRGSYINYEEKLAMRPQTPKRNSGDYDISPLLQNMDRRGRYNVVATAVTPAK